MDWTTRPFARMPCLVLFLSLLPCSLVLLSSIAAEPSPPRSELAYAERALRKAGAGIDGAGLLAFIRARTLSEEQRKGLANKVRALGSPEYTERETAGRELVALGRTALPYLRPAINDPDLETSRRARRCIEHIQRNPNPSMLTLAALLVKARRPDGAVPVMLHCLPSIEDEALEETWFDTLRVVGWHEGRADPALLAALTDKRPLLRAAAAHVLARGADAGARERVVPLLADTNARVRFEAAAGLARFGNKKAVGVLLALLNDGPFTLACQSEYLLRLLAEGHSPDESLDRDEAAVRNQCRGAWEAWWKKEGQHINLARLKREEPSHGLMLLCEDGDEGSRVWECGQGGQACWEVLHLEGAFAAQVLPGGRVLLAEHHANRVTERDAEGKILWEQHTAVNPIACQRQANGNTLIATYQELYEVTPDHKRVFRHTDRRDFRDALRLPNGHILYVTRDGVLVERDATCENLIRAIEPEEHAEGARYRARVEPLLNGRFLLTLGGSNRVLEIDAAGKIRWEHRVRAPMSATRLRNGNTLIACFEDRCIVEVDRAGKEINKQPLAGRPYAVRRY